MYLRIVTIIKKKPVGPQPNRKTWLFHVTLQSACFNELLVYVLSDEFVLEDKLRYDDLDVLHSS